ncbi:MAG: hypothetical protein K8F91_12195, partial [Candidatus Obscuribacterales bacterium]|nr:hypothetical protein [Candidatus Obscuribacterales bacterium]
MNRSTIAAKLKKLELLAPLMILFFQTPAVDALTEFKHYVNSKHSYEIDYPSFLKSPAKDATDEVSESCPEQKFISEDESIELSISFSAQDTGKKITLESKWNEALGERKKNADTINS